MYSTPFLYFFCVDIFFFYEFRYCLINNQLNCQHLLHRSGGFADSETVKNCVYILIVYMVMVLCLAHHNGIMLQMTPTRISFRTNPLPMFGFPLFLELDTVKLFSPLFKRIDRLHSCYCDVTAVSSTLVRVAVKRIKQKRGD